MKGSQLPGFNLQDTLVSMKDKIPRAIRLVFRYTPGWTSANIILIFILGLLPLASLYIIKLLVDTVTSGVSAGDKAAVTQELFLIIIAAVIIALIIAGFQAISVYVNEVQALELSDGITDLIHIQSMALDLAYYENPLYQDTLHRAQSGGPTRVGMIVNDVVLIARSCVSFIAVGALIFSYLPFAGIILIGSAIPTMLVRIWHSRKLYDLNLRQTELIRKSTYYHTLLTHSHYAKEIRLFSLGSFFRDLYNSTRQLTRVSKLDITRSKAIWDFISQGLVTAAVFGSFLFIAVMTLDGQISLGDMVMYFVGFQMCIGYIQSIFSSLNTLYDDHLFLGDFFRFLDLMPAIAVPDDPTPLPKIPIEEIRLSSISFTYPGAQHPALQDISITIRKGEVIAFVGENGAGKSTLIKLLCRLYLPDAGTITVDGIDMYQLDPDAWRRRLSVLFQDYIRYQLTVEDNIRVGDMEHADEPESIEQSARKAGAHRMIQRFPNRYKTMLGKLFSGGQEISTGEWQKIALSRAFFRDAELILLDEPASSLDALAEAEIFRKFREIISDRTAVIISHRFSTVRMADRIYVLEYGKIIEHGSHADLMALNGRYAKMFSAQADPYISRAGPENNSSGIPGIHQGKRTEG